jgi:heat shock protein HslJ
MRRLVFMLSLFLLISCSTTKNTPAGPSVVATDTAVQNEIIFYETEIDARQKNDLALLVGSWNIISMQRQARIDPEFLANTFLAFNANSTFTGKGGCNNIGGKFILKGTAVKFENIVSTKMSCNNIEQENTFLKLLNERVSAYTVTKDSLLLRDGSANIIFRASRK